MTRMFVPLLVGLGSALAACASHGAPPTPSATSAGVVVEASEARACDVVFDVGATKDVRASFAESVRGSFAQRGSRVAVAVASRTDDALVRSPFSVETAAAAATPTVISVTCYDRLGAALATSTARF